jgi:ParB family chromosome partitioning protein
LRDRLALEDDGIDLLAESIRKHGQQVPIMVRPSDQPDRYRVVYGRRRLAAIKKVGGPVKAIVRTLDDDASLIAQDKRTTSASIRRLLRKPCSSRRCKKLDISPASFKTHLD